MRTLIKAHFYSNTVQTLLTLSSVRRFRFMFCYSYIHLRFQLQLQLKGPCCNLSTIKAFVTVYARVFSSIKHVFVTFF